MLGLGDVYLGCPAALPVDPTHRIMNPKYNPARTYTPQGAIGIGGTFMCLYPTASPGGYQLVGRSLPIWNAFCTNSLYEQGKPWLLRMFDQVRASSEYPLRNLHDHIPPSSLISSHLPSSLLPSPSPLLQVRFFEVSEAELEVAFEQFKHGLYEVRTETLELLIASDCL